MKPPTPIFDLLTIYFSPNSSQILVCDSIRDPGNMGTLLRAASGAGVDGAILTIGCADAWSLKALRAGMGAQTRLPLITEARWTDIAPMLTKFGCRVCVADGDGSAEADETSSSVHYADYDWASGPRALIIGSEADGPSPAARGLAADRISIPLFNGVDCWCCPYVRG
jgi:RNA methyltransferase, TrmH family